MSVTTTTHTIGGISFRIYKRSKEDDRSVGVLFLLHGRHGSANDVDQMAQILMEKEIEAKRLDLFVVTLVSLEIEFFLFNVSITIFISGSPQPWNPSCGTSSE